MARPCHRSIPQGAAQHPDGSSHVNINVQQGKGTTLWPHFMVPTPRLDPPKHPRVLLRESEVNRQLGLIQRPTWRDRMTQRVGRAMVRIGTDLVERTNASNGDICVNNARQT